MSYKKSTIVDYDQSILSSYSESAKLKLAKKVLSQDDYASFDKIINVLEDPYVLFNHIVNKLDITAIELLIKKGKVTPEGVKRLQDICDFKKLFDNDDDNDDDAMSSKEYNNKASVIIKLLLEFQEKDNVTVQVLELLTFFLNKKEFNQFIKEKEINLSDQKFSSFKTVVYSLQETLPVLFQKSSYDNYVFKRNIPEVNILDILLSRSYSTDLGFEEISKIYRNLYSLSPVSKEIIHYTAALISKGNNIKILFGDDIDSHYNSLSNHIQISCEFLKKEIFNIQSVLIHELGHYIYEQVFEAHSRPFDFESIRNFAKIHKEDLTDPYIGDSTKYDIIYNDIALEEYRVIFQNSFSYEKVARKPIELAANMLKIDIKSLEKYISSNDLAEYFKDHSYIDLFLLSSAKNFNQTIDKLPDGIFDNIYNIYLSEQRSLFKMPPSREFVVKWATEEFFPLVKGYDLTPTKVHFLERMADYVNRGAHVLDPRGRKESDYERHVELIVRSSELRAAKVEPEIIDAFKGLDELHIKGASPKICTYIKESEVAAAPFEASMIGGAYSCLTVKVDSEITDSSKGLDESHIKGAPIKIDVNIQGSAVASAPFEVGVIGEGALAL